MLSAENILGKQLKLNGESAKKIMTTFSFRYVSYLLYGIKEGRGERREERTE